MFRYDFHSIRKNCSYRLFSIFELQILFDLEQNIVLGVTEDDDMNVDVGSLSTSEVSTQTLRIDSSTNLNTCQSSVKITKECNEGPRVNESVSHAQTSEKRQSVDSSTSAEAPGSTEGEIQTVRAPSNGEKSDSRKKEYVCVHCDITFGDQVLFIVHKGSHGFKEPFTCNMCGLKMRDKYEFAAHFHCT